MWIVWIGCGRPATEPVPSDGPAEVEMVNAMEDHYTLAIRAHDAVIRGQVDVAKGQLSALAALTLPAGAPEDWRVRHAPLQAAARSAAEAADVPAVAHAMAAVAQACGSCHEGLGRGPVYPAPGTPDAAVLADQMKVHQFATERLWEGVTGPFDHGWRRGTSLLAEGDLFDGKDTALESLETELRQTAAVAGVAATAQEKAVRYGEILASCARCHTAAGIGFTGG